jgi:aminopeptidase N
VDSTLYNTPGYRPYRDAVYLNGARFLDELRSLVGDDVFFEFLKDYLAEKIYQIATSADFFRILRTHSEADWSNVVSRYFQNP